VEDIKEEETELPKEFVPETLLEDINNGKSPVLLKRVELKAKKRKYVKQKYRNMKDQRKCGKKLNGQNNGGKQCKYTSEEFIAACDHFKDELIIFDKIPPKHNKIYCRIAEKVNDLSGAEISGIAVWSRFRKKHYGTEKYLKITEI
jgi:hypothetical protein